MFQGIDFRLTDKKIVDNVLDNDQIALAFSIFLGNGLVAIGELIGDDADAAQKEFQVTSLVSKLIECHSLNPHLFFR